VVACFVAAGRRARRGPTPTIDELFLGSCAAVLAISLLEWLAGGRGLPYHHLYMLPVVYVGAVQTRGRALTFLGLVAVVIWAPLGYQGYSASEAIDIGIQLVLLIGLALISRILFTVVRAQRRELERERQRAEERARRDGLTGLGNRLALEERLDAEIARARRSGSGLSLIIGDLDGFKKINDEIGHAGGDECLRRVAHALRQQARGGDECFRWGGDEFVILLPETTGEDAERVADRISAAVAGAYVSHAGRTVSMTCGTAELGADKDTSDLLGAADDVLFRMKRASTAQPEDGLPI
jgi:diguanylate cyclase (GGDEF)-like protein